MIPFNGNPLDRAGEKRHDADWLAARLADPASVVIAFSDGKPLLHDNALARVAHQGEPTLFLGVNADIAWFAVEQPDGAGFTEMRAAALLLSDEEAGIAASAKSLFDWHRRHGFCAVCGQATRITSAGWQRVCDGCGAEHFPRVDPVVIMLPLFEDRCLLGRAPAWPAKRMSALAGFIEPGETVEQACAREMHEEAGLVATRVTYHASQPWPFPSSLMIGLFAEVANDHAVADGKEIEEVRWLTRDEARAVLDGKHPDVLMPSRLGIAHNLVETWVNAPPPTMADGGPPAGRPGRQR
jgi:NAD+ diphosphatase